MNTASQNLPSQLMTSFESFGAQLVISNKSPNTIKGYEYDVHKFLIYLQLRGIRKPTAITSLHVMTYLKTHIEAGRGDATICRYYQSIKAYSRFLRRIRVLASDFTDDMEPPSTKQKAPRIPTQAQMELILAQPDASPRGIRDRAILELLYSSGLRASELCDLELRDFGGNSILVSCGKGEKTRTVPLTSVASLTISRYINEVRGYDDGYLFVTMEQLKAIRRENLSRLVREYALKAGVKHVTSHTLRHACATHLLDQGADLRLIQEVLGHASIASTQRYTHLSSKKIELMFNQFHPRK